MIGGLVGRSGCSVARLLGCISIWDGKMRNADCLRLASFHFAEQKMEKGSWLAKLTRATFDLEGWAAGQNSN